MYDEKIISFQRIIEFEVTLKKFIILILLSFVFYSGCTTVNYYNISYDLPTEFKDSSTYSKFVNTAKLYLNDKTFFIDPGHGGEDRVNSGPQKLAIEADVNLRVALYLRDFLKEAEANVILSRDKDTTVSLKDRSELANNSEADIFISIHHNSPGINADQNINYTSTYYHAKDSDYEFEPMEKDLARFIQRDLAYAMRNSGGLGSFDGTYSDYWIYPGKGFAVLRNTKIPAVLVECSFHSHPVEEQRLIIDEFNKIQAWGIFKGLYRYYRTGFPELNFISATREFDDWRINYRLFDSSGINPKSIRVYIDSTETENFKFDIEKNQLTIYPKIGLKNELEIRIIASNKFGNHTLPHREKIKLTNQK